MKVCRSCGYMEFFDCFVCLGFLVLTIRTYSAKPSACKHEKVFTFSRIALCKR